ncbi:zeta toxin family protein [Clostridium tyrobutyricum]|uniref:zeta toxin family protein n=1 Tax=Clostridium tyrobutyricum TaxID=1519 RepID=UPI0011C88A63|nr:zeta toxin family protein [Clostridium tyrobutyricum]
MKRVLIFAGPNGSGKSTIINKQKECVNFPEKYVCPDIMAQFLQIKNERDKYIKAMKLCSYLRNYYIKHGISFAMETVFSTKDKLDFINFAKSHGFFIQVIYITTRDSTINIERVSQRYRTGGHGVPINKIISRYNRSMSLLHEIILKSDSIIVLDNSNSDPIPIFSKNSCNPNFYHLNKEIDTSQIVDTYIKSKLIKKNFEQSDFVDLDSVQTEEYLKSI